MYKENKLSWVEIEEKEREKLKVISNLNYIFLIGLVVSMILLMQRIRSPKKKERKMYSPSENYLVENQRNYNT